MTDTLLHNTQPLLTVLPDSLKTELFSEYDKIVQNYHRRNWEGILLDAGRFCEHAFSIISHYSDGQYPQHSIKPNDFTSSCLSILKEAGLPRSSRVIVPYILIATYGMRNQRDSGHATKNEITCNEMDALFALWACKWILCEIIRLLDNTDPESSKKVIDMISTRDISPILWTNASGIQRVLDISKNIKEQVLLLLYYSIPGQITVKELLQSTEYKNSTRFRDILSQLHHDRLIDYDSDKHKVEITPLGIKAVEKQFK